LSGLTPKPPIPTFRAGFKGMTGDPERNRLDDLAARIDKAGAKPAQPEGTEAGDRFGLAKAGRMGFDFVATVMVCGAVGFLVDRQLGTRPWVMLGLLLAGFVAGLANMWRALGGYEQGIGWKPKAEDGNRKTED